MPYATTQDMIDRFGEGEILQLTDRAIPPLGVIDAQVLATVLADADSAIDQYLTGRYTLPLNPVPAGLKRVACSLARFYLYDDAVPEPIQNAYDHQIKFLMSVAKGEIRLGPDANDQSPPVTGGPQVTAPDRVFTHDSLVDL